MAFYLFKKTVNSQTAFACGKSKLNYTPAGQWRANFLENDTILQILYTDSNQPVFADLFDDGKIPVTSIKKENDTAYSNAEDLITAVADFFFRVSGSGGSVTAQFATYTDPVSGAKVRTGVRDGEYVIDRTITELGFAGVVNVDWEEIGGIV